MLVLCLAAMTPVLAQGPQGNPIYATIEYVDQRFEELKNHAHQQFAELSDEIAGAYDHFAQEIDRLDGRIDQIGGVTGPDFDLPAQEDWNVSAYTYSNSQGCVYHLLTLRTHRYPEHDPLRTCN